MNVKLIKCLVENCVQIVIRSRRLKLLRTKSVQNWFTNSTSLIRVDIIRAYLPIYNYALLLGEREREREGESQKLIEYCQINRTEHSADKLHLLRAWIGNISLCINYNTGDGIIIKHMMPRDAKSQMRPRVTRDCTFYGQNMKINPIMLIMNSSDPKWEIICGLKLSIHSNLLCSQFWAIQKQKNSAMQSSKNKSCNCEMPFNAFNCIA